MQHEIFEHRLLSKGFSISAVYIPFRKGAKSLSASGTNEKKSISLTHQKRTKYDFMRHSSSENRRNTRDQQYFHFY